MRALRGAFFQGSIREHRFSCLPTQGSSGAQGSTEKNMNRSPVNDRIVITSDERCVVVSLPFSSFEVLRWLSPPTPPLIHSKIKTLTLCESPQTMPRAWIYSKLWALWEHSRSGVAWSGLWTTSPYLWNKRINLITIFHVQWLWSCTGA
jgi:hypothetical protein